MDEKNFLFKNKWLILGASLSLSFVIFFQFYDIAIIRKNSFRGLGDGNQSASIDDLNKQKQEKKNVDFKDLDINLNVNLENLTEEELAAVRSYLQFKKIKAAVIPSGEPAVYGEELNISFDKVQEAINKVAPFDPDYGKEKIMLTGSDLQRYIKIGSQTSCQYCCGAKTLIFEDGKAACGCEHSQMMRGLAAYLIKNYLELSDEEILKELNTWKASFFPKQTLSEVLSDMEKSGKEGVKELLEEFPEFLPSMVGGC